MATLFADGLFPAALFSGSLVALVTPFADNTVDEQALAQLVRFHLDQGTHGLVPVGTTGEASTLSNAEHQRVIDIVVQEAAGQVPVLVGAGSNDTAHAVELTRLAAEAGADGVLHAVGYYNRPSQEGIYQHFHEVHAAAQIPIVVYNVPPRSVVDIEVATLARLAQLPGIVGIKDATRDLQRTMLEGAAIAAPFSFLSGEDGTAVAYNAQGGHGCISVTANVAPALCARLQTACSNWDYQTAQQIQAQLMPLHQALFVEPSPAGVKYACAQLGLCRPQCRLPIVPLSDNARTQIDQAMAMLA